MAIAGGGRLCRTRHEPRVDRRVKRDRHPVANPAGSPAIATPSPDAGEKMGARLDGQPQALPGRAALQRWISSCWFLFARTRENCASQETSYERAGHAAPGANLLLQHGLHDALLGNAKSAQVHLLTSFKMDPSFRDIAKKDPDLKAIQELI